MSPQRELVAGHRAFLRTGREVTKNLTSWVGRLSALDVGAFEGSTKARQELVAFLEATRELATTMTKHADRAEAVLFGERQV